MSDRGVVSGGGGGREGEGVYTVDMEKGQEKSTERDNGETELMYNYFCMSLERGDPACHLYTSR